MRDDAAEIVANAATCPRCGGRHTARQACTGGVPSSIDDTAAREGPPGAHEGGPSHAHTPAGVNGRIITFSESRAHAASPADARVITFGAPAPSAPTATAPRYGAMRRERALPSPLPVVAEARWWASLLRWCGAIIGTLVLISCVSVAGVYISNLSQVAQDAREALIAIAASVAVGVIFGVLLLWFAARRYAKVAYCMLAVVLITGGLAMLVAAPVVRQMNTPSLAEYRGFAALTWFGLLTTVLGVLLAALCVRWSMSRNARRAIARWARLIGSVYGVLIGLSGVLGMFGLLQLINAHSTFQNGREVSVVERAISLTAILAFSLVPGVLLTYHSISASMGESSGRYRPPVAAIAVSLFIAVLLLGQWDMSRASPVAAPMPLLHVAAAALPGIAMVAMASRGTPLLRGVPVPGLTWRQVLLAAAVSMTVGTTIALYVEGIGSAYAVILLLVHNGAFEFAANYDDVTRAMRDADVILTDNEQFFAGLITASLLAPVSEELGKSLGVRFTMSPTSTRAQAFLLGAAAGAAFGFLEGMLYGVAGIQGGLDHWWAIMLTRGGSTSLHVLCTGLTGLGWWYWTIGRRHRASIALFATAMLIHASWNAAFTLLESRILGLDTLDDRTLEIIAYTAVGIVSATMVLAIPFIARRLRDAPAATVAGTPLASMQAWMAY